jgi:hypothetical protein
VRICAERTWKAIVVFHSQFAGDGVFCEHAETAYIAEKKEKAQNKRPLQIRQRV